MVSGDTNGVWNIFVHDRQTGETELVNISSSGVQGDGSAVWSSISDDGRYVAFQGYSTDLVSGDTNSVPDIFVHDRDTGTTERVSINSSGEEGNATSYNPYLSGDGRYVVFESDASNLVAGDTNNKRDIFLYDRQTDTTEIISLNSSEVLANNASYSPFISEDARYVVFSSAATNLVSGDTNATGDVFIRDRTLGTTERISVGSYGTQANAWSENARMSADGRFVVFDALASNLVAGDTNGVADTFVYDRSTGITSRLSEASDGTQGDGASVYGSVSADGSTVAFFSLASNLVPGDTNSSYDVFVRRNVTSAILPGNGDATFDSGLAVDLGTDPSAIIAADLDGDSSIDLASADSATDSARVLLNQGDGSFGTSAGYSTGASPSSIASSDFNGDEVADLVTGNSGGGSVSVLLNNGDGTFNSASNYAVGSGPAGVAAADLNSDGAQDIITANYGDSTLSTLSGNSTTARKSGLVLAKPPLDPLDNTVKNRAAAKVAHDQLAKLLKVIKSDQVDLERISSEMRAALNLAYEGYRASYLLADRITEFSNAQELANALLREIRTKTKDTAIDIHANIDSGLAKELLSLG